MEDDDYYGEISRHLIHQNRLFHTKVSISYDRVRCDARQLLGHP